MSNFQKRTKRASEEIEFDAHLDSLPKVTIESQMQTEEQYLSQQFDSLPLPVKRQLIESSITGSDPASLEAMFDDFISFAVPTFKGARALTSLQKLKDEIYETENAIIYEETGLATEYVDCFMCLLHSMALAGISMNDFKQTFSSKLSVNKSRKWKQNADGTYSHIKGGQE